MGRILILYGRAHSVPRTTYAGRFELFASFVRILASHGNVGACLGSAASAQSSLPHGRTGTGSSVSSPVVFRTALRERRAVERDGHPCPHPGWVAALGVQTCWILFSGLYGLRGEEESCTPVDPLMHEVGCGLGRFAGAGARATRARKPPERRGKDQGTGFRLP